MRQPIRAGAAAFCVSMRFIYSLRASPDRLARCFVGNVLRAGAWGYCPFTPRICLHWRSGCGEPQRQPGWAGALLTCVCAAAQGLGRCPKPRQGVEPPAPRELCRSRGGCYPPYTPSLFRTTTPCSPQAIRSGSSTFSDASHQNSRLNSSAMPSSCNFT